jgi:hypothetical protein
MATLPAPGHDEQVAVPFCTRTTPLVEMHRSWPAEAVPAVTATSTVALAKAMTTRLVDRRRVRFMVVIEHRS